MPCLSELIEAGHTCCLHLHLPTYTTCVESAREKWVGARRAQLNAITLEKMLHSLYTILP